jgi:hypothetical protein
LWGGVQYSWQAAQLFNNVSSGDDQLTGKVKRFFNSSLWAYLENMVALAG